MAFQSQKHRPNQTEFVCDQSMDVCFAKYLISYNTICKACDRSSNWDHNGNQTQTNNYADELNWNELDKRAN